ncbi:SRPBCC family protein [Pseudomonas sp. NPDC089554]|uniref:SRPBCC family protein n=1 Tax=Pseudomonas sp. NPDC089554 TaxID=3390653 RepID=UPI003D081A0F
MQKSKLAQTAILGALLLGNTGLSFASSAKDQTSEHYRHPMASDLAKRDKNIHWPDGFSPKEADLFAHNEINVDASCAVVWEHIVAAQDWQRWYPNASLVKLPAGASKLESSSVFQWRTFGFDIESKIVEFEPRKRMGWFGYVPGKAPNFYHTWYLVPEGSGCRVVTEEVGKGADAQKFREMDESTLHRGHALWLEDLKWVSETPAVVTGLH